MYTAGGGEKATVRSLRSSIIRKGGVVDRREFSKEVDYALAVLGISLGPEDRVKAGLNGFQDFTAVATLVDKIHGLDDRLKRVVTHLDPLHFQEILGKAKKLYLCNDPDCGGSITLETIDLELRAGSVPHPKRKATMAYLASQNVEELTYLDFLAYLPLFMNIHDILDNPLEQGEE
jgi:hypothetical protein